MCLPSVPGLSVLLHVHVHTIFGLQRQCDQIGVHEQKISDNLLCFTNVAPHVINI